MILSHLLDFKSHLASFETVVEISADRVNDAEWGISAEIGATCHVTYPCSWKKFEDKCDVSHQQKNFPHYSSLPSVKRMMSRDD